VVIPVYLIIIRMKMYDTLAAIILPSIAFAIPLSVLVLANFIRDVPKELFESMWMDGATEWGTLWRLAFPLAGRRWSRSPSTTRSASGTGSSCR
jgi:raffinose/stachyose/melibiose transport system permease protein